MKLAVNKMVNKGVLFKKYDVPKVATGWDVNYSKMTIPRGGCIPYTIENGTLYFCLAKCAKSNELGDMGGGRKQWETICDTASRETNEESLGAFGVVTPKTIMENIVIYNKYMLICFVPIVSVDPTVSVMDVTRANFTSRLESQLGTGNLKKEELEIKELVWLSYDQLLNCCMATFPDPHYSFFMRVRRFLYSFFTEWMIIYHPGTCYLEFVKRPKVQTITSHTTTPEHNTMSQSLNQTMNQTMSQTLDQQYDTSGNVSVGNQTFNKSFRNSMNDKTYNKSYGGAFDKSYNRVGNKMNGRMNNKMNKLPFHQPMVTTMSAVATF